MHLGYMLIKRYRLNDVKVRVGNLKAKVIYIEIYMLKEKIYKRIFEPKLVDSIFLELFLNCY